MIRANYFNYIEEKLSTLAYRISMRGKLNILDLNIHSETFFADFCNIVFNLKLINLNSLKQNTEGIDLVDTDNKVVVQVSATCTKNKIESSLSKKIYEKYRDYNYKFISISKNSTDSLRKKSFKNPYKMRFDPLQDIWDIANILRKILSEGIEEQKRLYEFIRRELGQDIDYTKVETNLAKVINILAKEKLDMNAMSPEINSFAIEDKIEFNDLHDVRNTIEDYKIFYHRLDEIYSTFDREGKITSFSVLQIIRKQYIELRTAEKSSRRIFDKITDNVTKIVINSSNYEKMPMEELQVCVDILVVDAFIRCKIFNNPGGYNHVITR